MPLSHCLFTVLVGVTMAVASLAAPPPLSCRLPRHVDIGQPFLLQLVARQPLDEVTVGWRGRSVRVEPLSSSPAGPWRVDMVLGSDVRSARSGRAVVSLVLCFRTGVEELELPIELQARRYPVERLTVPTAMATPPSAAAGRIRRESAAVRGVLGRAGAVTSWGGAAKPFARPVAGVVCSTYGLRRYFNGQPRSPHRGLDIDAAAGTPVVAAARGTVALVGEHYFAGRSVYVDHGQGLVTAYFHLQSMAVREGQAVEGGQTIGAVGNTGRSTKTHLHFGVYSLGAAVDPTPLIDGTLVGEPPVERLP